MTGNERSWRDGRRSLGVCLVGSSVAISKDANLYVSMQTASNSLRPITSLIQMRCLRTTRTPTMHFTPVALPGHQQLVCVPVLALEVHTVEVYLVLRDAVSQ